MLPLCAKVKEKAIASELIMNLTIEGILSVRNGDHPIKIEEKLRGIQGGNDGFFQGAGAAGSASKSAEAIYRFQKV
jgi:hypothetical protein